MLQWTWGCSYLFETLISILLNICLKMRLLGHMVVLFLSSEEPPYSIAQRLTHWKRLWCWERLGAGGEGDDRGRDGWMASLTQWTWVWVNFRSWWWTGRPAVLQFMGSDTTEWLNWTELNIIIESHQQCTRVPIPSRPSQHLLSFEFCLCSV